MNYLKIKRENDRIFKNGSFPEMRSLVYTDIPPIKKYARHKLFSVSEHTVRQTTIECILNCPKDKRIAALNFANAMYPGGGYVLGGNAQEESLCRASMLYYAIRHQVMYRKNRLHLLPDYTHTLIYTKNVPVIRDENGNMLEKPRACDFITCPAVNRTFAKFMFSDKKITEKMDRRIELIIEVAAVYKPDILILGAFGCGVFGNKRETVFELFEKHINGFLPDETEVIFAIP